MTGNSKKWMRRRSWAPLVGSAAALWFFGAQPAAAQTWTGARGAPGLHEITAIDKTGEQAWPFGEEDVAGDGPDSFAEQEQAIDVRSAYAVADAQSFWVRAYVSNPTAVGLEAVVFVFIDADKNIATGGSAQGPGIDARLATENAPGGYEFVVGMHSDGTLPQVWTWDAAPPGQFTAVMVPQGQATAEAGNDVDPLLVGAPRRGYVQASVALGLVGITSACQANLYVRSLNDAAALGNGDLDVGVPGTCVPADGDGNGVPDVIVPPSGCKADTECPAGGLCVNGACLLAAPCALDTDCAPDAQCTDDGRCVPKPSGTCSASDSCGDLVCEGGQCGPCAPGSDSCGAGRRCAPTGLCVGGADVGTGTGTGTGAGTGSSGAGGGGLGLDPGDEVRGGACACAALPAPDRGRASALLVAAGIVLGLRRRSRRASRRAL